MSNFSCDDNIVLFLGNPDESGQTGLPSAFFPDVNMGIVCDFDDRWLLDLLNEFCLRERWAMTSGIATDNVTNLIENMTVGLTGSHSFVVKERAKLDRFMQAANRWHRGGKRNNSIWIYNQMSGESGIRRALIYNITSQDFPQQYPVDNGNFVLDMSLEIERHHVWENTQRIKTIQDTDFAYWGTVQRLRTTVTTPFFGIVPLEQGTDAGRIPYLHLFDLIRDGATRRIIATLWIGIKEDIGCGLDLWSPIWEAETGVDVSADTTTVVDLLDLDLSAFAYKSTDFSATTAEVVRFTMKLESAFSLLTQEDFEQFRGDYIVLARVRQTDPLMVITITMRYGWFDGGRKITVRQSPVIFTGEPFWKMVELGVVSIPPDSGKQSLSMQFDPTGAGAGNKRNNLSEFSIDIIAGLSSGAGEMHIDALYMIPFERHAKANYSGRFSPSFASFANLDGDGLIFATNEDDTNELRYLTSSGFDGGIDPISDYQLDSREFFLPENGSRIVYAANAFNEVPPGVYRASNIIGGLFPDDAFRLTTDYRVIPRWLTYRDE